MIVCVCRCISDRDIARHARAGTGFDEQCGQCESCARDVVAQCSATVPVAAIQHASQMQEGSAWNSCKSSQ